MKKTILILFATLAIASCDLLYNQDSDSFSSVNDISISAIETTPFVKRGEIVTVGITVTNSGTNTVDEEFEISLNNQSEGVTIGNKTLASSLAPKDSIRVNYSWDTGNIATGTQTLVAKHTFKDDNAANDSLKTTVIVSEPDSSDIAVSEIRLPNTIVKGNVVDVEVDVKNIGSKDVNETITIALTDITDGTTIGNQQIEGGFATGDSTTITYSWDTKEASIGDHELSASHNFEDENTANDILSTNVNISEAPITDIAVTAIDAPLETTQGTDTEVSVTVENVGNLDTSEEVTVTLRDQTTGQQIASQSISGLEAENTTVLTFTWNTHEASIGEHTLQASHNFEDENTANDARSTNVTINEAPVTDIAVSEIRLPNTIVKGSVVDIEVDLKNIGSKDVEETIAVALNDVTDGTTIGTQQIEGGFSAGDSTTITYSWDTQGYSIGEHELSASHDFTDGNTTNDTRTVIVTINDAPVTDIAVTTIEAPSEATQGDNVEVSVTVENMGNLDTSEDVTVTLRDQTTGQQIASQSISGLEAENAAVLTFTWNTDEASIGEHTLQASHNFEDENTSNDARSTNVTINEAPVTDIAVTTIEAPSEATQGDNVEVSVTVENVGNLDTSEDVTVTLRDQTTGQQIASQSISGLEAENAAVLTFVWNTEETSVGEHTLQASHNFEDDNTSNDSHTAVVNINDPPVTDIAVTTIEAPSEATQGDNVEVTVTVENVGNLDTSEDVTVTLRDQTTGQQIASQSISGLEAENAAVLTFVWNTEETSVGEHTLQASHNFEDDNTSNDARSTEIRISEAPVTDIAVTVIDAPSEATQGDNVEVTVEINNQGNQDIGNGLTIALVNQTNGSTIGSQSISGGVDAGATTSVTFNWDTDGASTGNHILAASHNLDDDNSDNDSKSIEIRIIEEILDITITTVDAPDNVEKDDRVLIEVTLSNQGNRDVNEDIIVTLADQTEDRTIGSETLMGGLEIGSTETLGFVWNTTGGVSEGEHTLIVSHDFDDYNLANNSRTFEIEVEDD